MTLLGVTARELDDWITTQIDSEMVASAFRERALDAYNLFAASRQAEVILVAFEQAFRQRRLLPGVPENAVVSPSELEGLMQAIRVALGNYVADSGDALSTERGFARLHKDSEQSDAKLSDTRCRMSNAFGLAVSNERRLRSFAQSIDDSGHDVMEVSRRQMAEHIASAFIAYADESETSFERGPW